MVTLVCSRPVALLLTAVLAATTTGSAFAQAAHPVCAAKQHDCGRVATIAKCCCGEQEASHPLPAPAQSRFESPADTTSTATPPIAFELPQGGRSFHPIQTSPPCGCLIDLPTLYVSFLI